MTLFKTERPTEQEEILAADVIFMNEDLEFSERIKTFTTDINVVTISSVEAKDIKVEEYKLEGEQKICLNFPLHRTIIFKVEVKNLQDLLSRVSQLYVEIMKNYSEQADVCCSGFEHLYIKEIRIHKDNEVSFKMEQDLKHKK